VLNTFIHFSGGNGQPGSARMRALRRVRTDPSPPPLQRRTVDATAPTHDDDQDSPRFPAPSCMLWDVPETPMHSPRACSSGSTCFSPEPSLGMHDSPLTGLEVADTTTPASPPTPPPFPTLSLQHALDSPQLSQPYWFAQQFQYGEHAHMQMEPYATWPAVEAPWIAPSVAATSPSLMLTPVTNHMSFTVTVRPSDGIGLGLEVICDCSILITEVQDGGCIKAWNRQCIDGKEWKAIRPGDRIVSVNGKQTWDDILSECRRSNALLKLQIERPDVIERPMGHLEVIRFEAKPSCN